MRIDLPATEPGAVNAGAVPGFSSSLVSPVDGQYVSLKDVDAMVGEYERLDMLDKQVYATKVAIRESLAKMTEGDAKTRRVAGKNRVAKLTFPGTDWTQSILREAWEAYPHLRDQYLRISQLAPNLREVKKLANTSGTPDLNTFRDMITSAERELTRPPTLAIEK